MAVCDDDPNSHDEKLRELAPKINKLAENYASGKGKDVRPILLAMIEAPDGEWQERLYEACGVIGADELNCGALWYEGVSNDAPSGRKAGFYLREMIREAAARNREKFNTHAANLAKNPGVVSAAMARRQEFAQILLTRARRHDGGATLDDALTLAASVNGALRNPDGSLLAIREYFANSLEAAGCCLTDVAWHALFHWTHGTEPARFGSHPLQEVGYHPPSGPTRDVATSNVVEPPRFTAPPPQSAAEIEGPIRPGHFRFGTFEYSRFGDLQWKLIKTLWDLAGGRIDTPVLTDEVLAKVYPKPGPKKAKTNRLQTLRNDTNDTLARQGFLVRIEWHKDDSMVLRRISEMSSQRASQM